MLGEVAESGSVDHGAYHLGCAGGLDEVGVVVTDGDGSDLCIDV